jgi:excisionase family DNA binding protein
MQRTETENKLLTLEQAAEAINSPVKTIRRLIITGKLPIFQIARNCIRVDYSDLISTVHEQRRVLKQEKKFNNSKAIQKINRGMGEVT